MGSLRPGKPSRNCSARFTSTDHGILGILDIPGGVCIPWQLNTGPILEFSRVDGRQVDNKLTPAIPLPRWLVQNGTEEPSFAHFAPWLWFWFGALSISFTPTIPQQNLVAATFRSSQSLCAREKCCRRWLQSTSHSSSIISNQPSPTAWYLQQCSLPVQQYN